jgi:hypothetical protein
LTRGALVGGLLFGRLALLCLLASEGQDFQQWVSLLPFL